MTAKDRISSKRTTIYDLAEIVGTSPTAVSSVLNGSWKKRRISQKLADRVLQAAQDHGYAVNIQASVLRRERSNIIGMIIPKYDNRFFGAIAEQFEERARAQGLFPVITCTQRDPALEVEAARELLSYQVDCLIATGATNPDRIAEICSAAGVRTLNLDLPGSRAPSVISDSYTGARDLAALILDACAEQHGAPVPLVFVGGRADDHNTRERLRGFRDAHAARSLPLPEGNALITGYGPDKARMALTARPDLPKGLFVNSTITLDGVVQWLQSLPPEAAQDIRYGTFDWDPLGALLPQNVGMIRQDVSGLLDRLFVHLTSDAAAPATQTDLVPCILHPAGARAG